MTQDSTTLIEHEAREGFQSFIAVVRDLDTADSLLGELRFEVTYAFDIYPEDKPRQEDLWVLQVRLRLNGEPGPLVYDCGYSVQKPPVDCLAEGALDYLAEMAWQDWSQRAAYLDEPYDS